MAFNFNKKMCLPKLPASYRPHLNFDNLVKSLFTRHCEEKRDDAIT